MNPLPESQSAKAVFPVIETQGLRLPKLGLGTYRLQGAECRTAVSSALALGYRHIDTAEMYQNEDEVGAAITASPVPRDHIHLTTKVWHTHLAPDAIRSACDASLARLKTDYVDLYLVHWPAGKMDLPAIFETLLQLKAEGRIRALGVCNFTVPLLRTVIEEIRAPIACNQIEYHILLDQTPVRSYLAQHAIPVTAYSPLAQGALATNTDLAAIARKHQATPAQVALKWLLDQPGVAVIPKAKGPGSQRDNLHSFKINLDDADRQLIAALPKNQRFVNPSFAPAWDAPVIK